MAEQSSNAASVDPVIESLNKLSLSSSTDTASEAMKFPQFSDPRITFEIQAKIWQADARRTLNEPGVFFIGCKTVDNTGGDIEIDVDMEAKSPHLGA
jgi:hypothetical protein